MPEAYKMDFTFIEDEELRTQAEEAYTISMQTVTEGIQTKIDAAIEGLQNKNVELLGEKKAVQEKLAKFADITDPEKALEALKFINENEDAQLIKDGKIGEIIERRTSTMRIEHENALTDLAEKLESSLTGETHYKGMYETKVMDDAMRAVAVTAGVRAEAVPDILLRAKSMFSLDDKGEPEARDSGGKLKKNDDGNVMTPGVWLEDLKVTSPHYWPTSRGSGAVGGNLGADADTTAKLADLVAKNDMAGYRALRAKMQGKV